MESAEDHRHEIESLRRALESQSSELSPLLDRYRASLRRMVRFRLDPRLQTRVDPSDVIQDTYIEAYRRLNEYLADPTVPFFIWLRFLATQRMAQLHQTHLGVQARDMRREVSLSHNALPELTSAAIAAQLVGRLDTPVQAVLKAELRHALVEILNRMTSLDREVLVLRHYEQLKNQEVAIILGIDEGTASKRYYRALAKVKSHILEKTNGVLDLFQ